MRDDIGLPNYALGYDEELDAVCSLELLAQHLPRVISVPHHWKWVILSLHNSLQGFMVLALQGTNALNVLTKGSAKRWYEGYDTGQYPDVAPQLDKFMGLYEKIKSNAMSIRVDSRRFVPEPSQDESVRRLNAFRNEFVHYTPATSLLDMRQWAQIALDVIPIVEFLAFESNNVSFHEGATADHVRGLCAIGKNEALALLSHYGA
jgi:hypothetical protein